MSEKIMKRNGEFSVRRFSCESDERVRLLEKENQELKNRIRTLKVMLSEDTSEIRTLGMMLDDIVIHFENTVDDRLMRMHMESIVIRYRKYLRERPSSLVNEVREEEEKK